MLSTAWPTIVDPIVRIQRWRPSCQTFIFASTNEFTKSPAQKERFDASTIRHVLPNIISSAGWYSLLYGSSGSIGRRTITSDMIHAKTIAARPTQITRRAFASVSYTHLRAHETPEHLVCRL